MVGSAFSYIWGLIGKFVPQALYLVTNIILARLLTPTDFGMIAVLGVFFSIANVLIESGIGAALINKDNIDDNDINTLFTFNLTMSVIVYTILFVLSTYIEEYFNIDGLGMVVKVVSLIFVINPFGMIVNTLMSRELKFKQLSLVSIISVVVASLISISMGFFKFGVYALVGYQIAYSIARVVALRLFRPTKVSLHIDFTSLKNLFSFGVFNAFANIIDGIYENILSFLIGKYMNASQAGYFSQAKKIEESTANSIVQTINGISFPIFSRISSDKALFEKESNKLVKIISVILFPCLVVLLVFSKEIIDLLFGHKWIESTPYLRILIFAGFFMILDSLYRNLIKSYGKIKVVFNITLYKRLIGLSLIFLSLIYSIDYILWAYVMSALIGYQFMIINYCKTLNISYFKQILFDLKNFLPSALILSILFICDMFVPFIYLLLFSICLLCTYYFVILPRLYHVDILSFIKKVIVRRK